MGFLSRVLKLCTKLCTSWLIIGLIYRFLELDSSKDEYFYTFSLPVESFLHTGQFSSVAQSCPPLCDPMDCSMPGFLVHHQLPELAQIMSIEFVMPSNHLILCHPLLLPSVFSSIRVFSNLSVFHIRWPKYWSFSFSISPSNEYSGLISFRMDWLDLLAVQGTLKGLLQHHSLKASILRRLAFFMVQLSHPYMTAGKTIALTRQTFASKVMSLLFNMLSAAAAAAKLLQSCPTLCDPIDGSPPGPAVPGILQARTLEWVAISSSNA